jgi:8-oxo-dGTP pyrophosphatase MutT (NUDIX family)
VESKRRGIEDTAMREVEEETGKSITGYKKPKNSSHFCTVQEITHWFEMSLVLRCAPRERALKSSH